jgi:hypothetical protein
VFGDQTLIVDMLAKTLPKDWKLYVKEHPWQLQPFGWGEMQRTQEFYDTIAGYPNVVLVSRDVETSELVSGSKAVATVTGSVGWDALCRNSGVAVRRGVVSRLRWSHKNFQSGRVGCRNSEPAFGQTANAGWGRGILPGAVTRVRAGRAGTRVGTGGASVDEPCDKQHG